MKEILRDTCYDFDDCASEEVNFPVYVFFDEAAKSDYLKRITKDANDIIDSERNKLLKKLNEATRELADIDAGKDMDKYLGKVQTCACFANKIMEEEPVSYEDVLADNYTALDTVEDFEVCDEDKYAVIVRKENGDMVYVGETAFWKQNAQLSAIIAEKYDAEEKSLRALLKNEAKSEKPSAEFNSYLARYNNLLECLINENGEDTVKVVPVFRKGDEIKTLIVVS